MALTVTKRNVTKFIGGFARVVRVTFDSSYPTGGEALTAATLGFDDEASELTVIPIKFGPIVPQYNGVGKLLLAYWGNAGTASVLPEVTDTTDLSAQTVELLVIGRKPDNVD